MLCLIRHVKDFFISRVSAWENKNKNKNQGKTERFKLVDRNWQVNVPKCLHKTVYIFDAVLVSK